jgi:hypothetical protein
VAQLTLRENENSPMTNVSFRCPLTGMTIHHWIDDQSRLAEEMGYETLECPACLRRHLIDRSTGELVPEEDTGEVSPPTAP